MVSDGDYDAYGNKGARGVRLYLETARSRPKVPRIALPWWKEQCRKLSVIFARLAETRG